MRSALWLLALGAASVPLSAAPPTRPFPQHATYAATVRRPSPPQTDLDRTTASFYDTWKQRYVRLGNTPGQRYVFFNREHRSDDAAAISVSEGHGYGMLLAALFAGHDPDARSLFDSFFAWFRAHPSHVTPELMCWKQQRGGVDAQDNDSAADGDLDIAYALLLADAQWGSNGPIAYKAEALKLLRAITTHEVSAEFGVVLLGDWAKPGTPFGDATRLSDFMPGHFRLFAAATGDPLWSTLRDRGYEMVAALQQQYAPRTGLVPDFARVLRAGSFGPVGPRFLEDKSDGDYAYNACRVPWRIGTDWATSGDPRARQSLERMNQFVEARSGTDPKRVRAGYRLASGAPLDRDDCSLAFTAPFAVAAMTGEGHQRWLDALWKHVVSVPASEDDYYGNTVKLLCLVVLSGNWWEPS